MSISSALIPAGGLALNGFHHQTNTNIAGYNQTSRYVDARATYDAFLFGEAPVPKHYGELLLHLAQLLQHIGDRLYYQYMRKPKI